jgi:hypothetical protein
MISTQYVTGQQNLDRLCAALVFRDANAATTSSSASSGARSSKRLSGPSRIARTACDCRSTTGTHAETALVELWQVRAKE